MKAAAASLPATSQPTSAPQPPQVVTQTLNDMGATVATLANGLTVIIQENHNSPVVTVRCHVRAGGMLEGKWLGCGLSHLVEHLVAEGAEKTPGAKQTAGANRSRLDAIGAQSNASTGMDETQYYIDVASSRTNDAIEIVADWMARPQITTDDFLREHGVVQRELEMGRDDAQRQLEYAHMANFYGTHPAGVPVIGYIDALKTLTFEDVQAYHAQMYVPQNMVFVVVGDVNTAEVMEKIRTAMAGFEALRHPAPILPEVPYLAGVRRVVLSAPGVKDVTEQIGFRSIPLIHPDLYALDVLSFVLTNGESSRLNEILKRQKKLVTSVESSSWTPYWGAGLFNFEFRAEPNNADVAEAALLAEISRLVQEGVTAEELAKAKQQKVAEFVYSRQSVESQAQLLASDFLSADDVNFSRQYTERIQSITAEQVQAAAKKYLTPGAMAITRLVPASSPEAPKMGPSTMAAGQTLRFKLDNGLTVILRSTTAVDLVAMNLACLGGVLTEDEKTNGLGTLMTELSLKGAGELNADQIADFFDRSGGAISSQCGNNTFMWEATVLKAQALEAAGILGDVVCRPTFPDEELARLRPQILAAIGRVDEQWSSQLQRFFKQKFYTNSPYRFLTIGSADVAAKADRQAIAGFHDKWVKAGSAVLSVFGNFDVQAMRRLIEQRFASLGEGKAAVPVPAPRKVAAEELYVLATPNQQAAIMIGWPGMRLTDAADYDTMSILYTIMSGYQLPSGWLHEELRGRQLVYVVHAVNWAGWAPGAFFVYAATQPDKAQEVISTIRRLIARATTESFAKADMDQAINTILTAELLGTQTMRELSMQSTLDELYGFGYDYRRTLEKRLRAVTPEDLHRVAQKYLAGPAVETVTTPAPKVVDPAGKYTEAAQAKGPAGAPAEE
jgi:zinc protease